MWFSDNQRNVGKRVVLDCVSGEVVEANVWGAGRACRFGATSRPAIDKSAKNGYY
jgi:hypothetical protein